MPIPDLRVLLPRAAKERLTEYFLAQLEAAELDWHANPKYGLTNAYREADTSHNSWLTYDMVSSCFEAALVEYNRRHPLCWDNETQKAFRA